MVSKDFTLNLVNKLHLVLAIFALSCIPAINASDAVTSAPVSINQIEAKKIGNGEEILIIADKSFEHSAFLLSDPQRLVIDIPNADLQIEEGKSYPEFAYFSSIKSRLIKQTDKELVRIELLLNDVAPYQIESLSTGIKISFGQAGSGKVNETADAHSMTQSLPKPGEPAQAESAPAATATNASSPAAGVYGLAPPTQYKGKPIFLDLKDADILDIFRLIAEVSGFNVVVDPDVGGRITIRMDNVPWDQALEVILKNQGLGKEIEGNIMRIAKNDKLRAESELKAQLEASKRKAEPLETIIMYLSYAEIAQMETTLKIFLSERGSIVKDIRTNALIIRDIRFVLENVKEMVKILDVRTRQVALNAQIVTTEKSFQRQLGIQWGGKFIADAVHGNTTRYNFPNNIAFDFVDDTSEKYAINLPAGNQLFALTFGNILDTLKLNIALSAAESEGLSKTIARPRITTANNQAATISSGQQIPYDTFTPEQGTTTSFINASTTLNITPHITNDAWVSMQISLTRDSPGSVAPGSTTPPINTNSASTNVLVKDGDTLVIGGLNDSTFADGSEKIPWMGDIPVLGWLFKNNTKRSAFKDLLFFITPQILAEGEQVVKAEDF